MKILSYDVTNNHPSGPYDASVRVKKDGVHLASVKMENCSDTLKWIRTRPLSVERKEFVAQLQANNVPQSDIEEILRLPKSSKAKIVNYYECGK